MNSKLMKLYLKTINRLMVCFTLNKTKKAHQCFDQKIAVTLSIHFYRIASPGVHKYSSPATLISLFLAIRMENRSYTSQHRSNKNRPIKNHLL